MPGDAPVDEWEAKLAFMERGRLASASWDPATNVLTSASRDPQAPSRPSTTETQPRKPVTPEEAERMRQARVRDVTLASSSRLVPVLRVKPAGQ